MSDVQRMRFQEELRKAIERNRRPWSGTATIERREVEEIGASLGMIHKEAYVQFLALRERRFVGPAYRQHYREHDPLR